MATTLAECQTLVTAVAALAATYVKQESRLHATHYREHQQAVVADAGTTTIDLVNAAGALLTPTVNDLTAVTATWPVARLNASSTFLQSSVRAIALVLAKQLDALSVSLYASYNTNSPVGTPATALTDATMVAAEALLMHAPKSEQRTVAIRMNSGYTDITKLATMINAATSGPLSIGNFTSNRVSKYRGMTLIPSDQVIQTGGGPVTTNNLAYTYTATGLVTVQRTLTNDATHVEAMSETGAGEGHVGLSVALAADGSDTQVLTFRLRAGVLMARNAYAVQVRS